ncbi:MAG TPA: hypothetical protein VNA20_03450 [Frankiaceae bacterium]|nr:hypothetical protein [Frankiaceae bacterium]
MRPHRLLVPLVALTLFATACGEGRPEAAPRALPTGSERYVGERDGALVGFELTGDVAGQVTELLPDKEGQWYVPMDGRAGAVSVTRFTEGPSEDTTNAVGVIDAATGRMVEGLGKDGPAAGLLLAPDGRHRYELISPSSGVVTSIDRTDATGGSRTTLVAEASESDTALSSAALSPDGRTLYVVKSPWEKPPTLHAVDTSSGRTTQIETRLAEDVYGVVVSPDGRTLALTVDGGREGDEYVKTRVALLPVAGGAPRWVDAPNASASAFTRAGDVLLVLDNRERKLTLALADVRTGAVRPLRGGAGIGHAVSAD